MAAYEEI
jgi:dynein intermediate chain 1